LYEFIMPGIDGKREADGPTTMAATAGFGAWEMPEVCLVKSVRWDEFCFIGAFVKSITPSPHNNIRPALRRGAHKAFTIFASGFYPYAQKPSPYPEEALEEKKVVRSRHQSTTFVTPTLQSPVFGHNRENNDVCVGAVFQKSDALINRCFIGDSGTVTRSSYEADTEDAAKALYERATRADAPILFDNSAAFEAALEKKKTATHNEVLARIRWQVSSSAMGIFKDNFKSRCVAHYYAERIRARLKQQYQELPEHWDEHYQVPIVYYLPGHEKNWTCYDENAQQQDKEEAEKLMELANDLSGDSSPLSYLIKNGNGEALLLHDDPIAVWNALKQDDEHPILQMVLEAHQTQLVTALHWRAMQAGLISSLEEELQSYAQSIPEHWVTADALGNAICDASKSGKVEELKCLLAFSRSTNDLSTLDKYCNSAFRITARIGHEEVLQVLLAHNRIDVNDISPATGFNALHEAALKGNESVVRTLLADQRVDVNIGKWKRGMGAAFWARNADHILLAVYIESVQRQAEWQAEPYDFVIQKLRAYASAESHFASRLYRFFKGEWNRHHTSAVARLLVRDNYKDKTFDKDLLTDFLTDLKKAIGDKPINPVGSLNQILYLAKLITEIDFASLPVDRLGCQILTLDI
jgi:Ankyrin repeats (3 copies)